MEPSALSTTQFRSFWAILPKGFHQTPSDINFLIQLFYIQNSAWCALGTYTLWPLIARSTMDSTLTIVLRATDLLATHVIILIIISYNATTFARTSWSIWRYSSEKIVSTLQPFCRSRYCEIKS